MKRLIKHCTLTTLIAASFVVCAPFSMADDTEIFEALPPSGADNRPNVLLIIDSSGSMSGNVTTQEDWDPSINFDGSCEDDKIYWQPSGSGSLPSCSGSTQNKISATNFVCQAAANAIATVGQATVGEIPQWKNSGSTSSRRWEALLAGRDTYVECRADHPATGTHNGITAGDNRVPRNNSGSFSGTGFSTSGMITSWGTSSYTFYTGNRLNYLKGSGNVTKTRLEIVKQASKDMLDQLLDGSVNVGLMRFENRPYYDGSDSAQGGYVIHEMGKIEDIRTALKTRIDGLGAVSWTPLTETMFEAFRYYTGGAVHFGNQPLGTSILASRRAAPLTNLYKSPLANSCQTNYVVLLTDGEPTKDSGADTLITGLSGFANRHPSAGATCSNNVTVSGDGDGTGRCLDDIAEYMYQRPDIANADDKIGKKIQTYTIGFGPAVGGSTNIQNAATLGGGQFYTAGDSSSLATAFSQIFRNIISTNVTFTSPTISVNAFNRTRNLDQLFFTVFQPESGAHWPGNIKKYKILGNGTIVDSNSAPAVDPTTGFFSTSSQSFWSAAVDGADVNDGGAAFKIPDGGSVPGVGRRNVFTDIAAFGPATERTLSDASNAVSTANTSITGTPALLGLSAGASTAEVDELITWARGEDDDGTQRYVMGDPLHARPAAVVYGGSATAPDVTVFAATNDGYLHAINGSTGVELWSYIPSELLPRLELLKTNGPVGSKQYGLDGSLTVYQTDTGVRGVVDGTDEVLLFFGMGRGGTRYYALDVTDRNNPKLLWRHGATGTLISGGQTWSTPNIVKVRIGSTVKLAMVVGGGYDPTQDSVATNTDDTGNRIFMLDARTGAMLWHAGPTNVLGAGHDSTADFQNAKMLYSIPSEIRIVDTGTDGLADRMYVGDMGGQLWRFDINNGQPASSLVTGGVIASLGAASGSLGASPADARRFYAAPDLALAKIDGQLIINIGIGSGFRGHPLNTEVNDRFYSVRDTSPLTAMNQAAYDSYTVIRDENYDAAHLNGLFDLTTLSAVSATTDPDIPGTARGWKLELRTGSTWGGEKVLSESRTFDDYIFFSTFKPNASVSSTSCAVNSGTNKLYAICITGECRRREFPLNQAGIAPEPVVVRPPPPPPEPPCTSPPCTPPPCVGDECTKPTLLIGAERVDIDMTYEMGKIFWKSKD